LSYVKNAVRSVRTLSVAEQRKVLDVSGEHRDGFRDHVIISLALSTGMRESEIAALNVGDVAKSPREIRTRWELKVFAQKGTAKKKAGAKEPATQPVFPPKILRRKLLKFMAWKKREAESLAPDAPLFCAGSKSHNGAGARLATRTMRHMWRLWQKRAGFDQTPFTFHELRHTCLTTLYKRTKDLLLVRRAARHKNVSTTTIYAHTSDDDLRAALEDQPG
jgi:integrase